MFSTSLTLFLLCKYAHLYYFCVIHMQVILYDICFSNSDLLHSVWQSLGQSTANINQWERTECPEINPGVWDLSFLTRDPTRASCCESTESELLNCQGNLPNNILNSTLVFELCLHLILKKTGNTVPIWVLFIAGEDLT